MNTVKKTFSIYTLCTVYALQAPVHAKTAPSYIETVQETVSDAVHTVKRTAKNVWNNRSQTELFHIKNQLMLHVASMRENTNTINAHNFRIMNELYDECCGIIDIQNNPLDAKLAENMRDVVDFFKKLIKTAEANLEEMAKEAAKTKKTVGKKTGEIVDAGIEKVKSGVDTVRAVIHDATTPTTSEKIEHKMNQTAEDIKHNVEIAGKEAEIIGKEAEIVGKTIKHGTKKEVIQAIDATKKAVSQATK